MPAQAWLSERLHLVARRRPVDVPLPPEARRVILGLLRRGRRVVSAVEERRCRLNSRGLVPIEADYLEVLDGRSLNVHVTVPAALVADRPLVQLSLRRGNEEYLTPLRVESDPSENASVTGLVRLEESGRELRPGTWSLGLVISRPRPYGPRTTMRFGLLPPATPAMRSGPTRLAPVSRSTGRRYIPYAAEDTGVLSVRATRPWAEVTSVRIGFSEVEVEGLIVPVRRRDDGALPVWVTDRSGEHREEVVAQVRNGTFRYSFPLDAMAAAAEKAAGEPREQIWDSHLRLPAVARRVRVGKLLTEAVDPRAVHQGKSQIVRTQFGALVRARYYYTAAGSLAIGCSLLRPAPQASTAVPGDQL